MQKIYLLLRNNKQSGPFNLDDLLQLKLKPFDLIWVEGKSGGWSYPTEIDALKDYVAEKSIAPEKTERASSMAQTFIAPPPQPITTFVETNTDVTTPKTPPAKHIYISLPAGMKISQVASTSQPEFTAMPEEETPEAKLERKAVELRNKIQAFTENKNKPKTDNELDTKYTRSLDDIKDEYSSWLYKQQKKKTVISKKPMLAVASLLFLLGAGYFMFSLFFNGKTNNSYVLTAEEIVASVPVVAQTNSNAETNKVTQGTKIKPATKKIKTKTPNQSIKKNTATNEIEVVDAYLDSLRSIESKKKLKPVDEIVSEEASTDKNGDRQSTRRDDVSTIKKTISKESETTPFAELIKLSESTGNGTPHLSLYNNSNKHINFVAIDVFYYKANQKLLQKKTLYFNNIAPKSSAKLFVPQQRNAGSVKYEMGLISTDGGLYYAKQ